MTRKQLRGTAEILWFDVTEYEGFHEGNRRNRSPMLSFLLLDSSQVTRPTTKHFFTIDFFENWLLVKRKTVQVFIALWILLRLLNVLNFVAYDLAMYHLSDHVVVETWNSTLNSTDLVQVESEDAYPCRDNRITSRAFQKTILLVVFVLNTLQLLFDLIDIPHKIWKYRKSWYRWTEKGKKQFAVQVLFYRLMQFLAELAMSVGALSVLFPILDDYDWIADLIYIQVSLGVTWSLMYFLQLAPWIGKMVVTVQRMINDLCKYCLLYSMFLVSFAHSFLRLISQGTNETRNCSRDFASIPDAWYR